MSRQLEFYKADIWFFFRWSYNDMKLFQMERIDNWCIPIYIVFAFFFPFSLYFAFAVEKNAHKSYFFYRDPPPP